MTWTTRPRSKIGALAAIEAGDAARERPLVVLLHGVGLRAESWAPIIDALKGHCRVLAFDLPGHGASARLNKTDPLLADFTAAVADAIPEPTVLIGHSMGAMIALDVATRFSTKVQSVVALNAIFERTAEARKSVLQRLATLNGRSLPDPAPTLQRWFGDGSSPQRQACADWLSSVDLDGYRDAYNVFARSDGPSRDALKQMQAPALFVTGEHDANSTPDMSKAMARRAPNGQSEVISGAGHMLPMTHADQVVPHVEAIITDTFREPAAS